MGSMAVVGCIFVDADCCSLAFGRKCRWIIAPLPLWAPLTCDTCDKLVPSSNTVVLCTNLLLLDSVSPLSTLIIRFS